MKAMLVGGTVAGAIDIVYALIANTLRAITPISILQSVATGLLGRPAYRGGCTLRS